MLRKAFENVVPYIANIGAVREFVDDNEGKDTGYIINELEKKISTESGTLVTDYKILLNELKKMINTEL